MDKLVESGEWIKYAGNDLDAINILSTHHPLKIEIICYLCQQSAEKMLKAFLVFHSVQPPKIHELDKLCESCNNIDNAFAELYLLCDRLNPYANQPRYPFGLEVTEDDMRLAISDCKKIRDFVMNKLESVVLDNPEDTYNPEESDDPDDPDDPNVGDDVHIILPE